jgi:hypothetical protein
VRATFFAVALVSVAIALIGTGLAETMFKTNLHNGVSGGAVDFLTGTKSFDKQ